MSSRTLVISLGGSMIVPEDIDVAFLRRFKQTIEQHLARTTDRIVIIAGGGSICRRYNRAALAIGGAASEDQDWIGIAATWLNAELVRVMFRSDAHPRVLQDPTARASTRKRILVSRGWKPGHSSDMVAVEFARTYGASTVINFSNVSHVYSADPQKDARAIPIEDLTWREYVKLIPRTWTPGMNTPFDPIASRNAQKYGMSVFILSDPSCKQLAKALKHQPFVGTRIHP